MEPAIINPTDYGWDFPQFCFGGDGFGNYGLWAFADYYNDPDGINSLTRVVFIPIFGFDAIGTGTNVFLTKLQNSVTISNPTVATMGDSGSWL